MQAGESSLYFDVIMGICEIDSVGMWLFIVHIKEALQAAIVRLFCFCVLNTDMTVEMKDRVAAHTF